MAPFQYQQYRNPYATTLASLVGAGDHARADAERQRGAIVGNAVGNIAQTGASTLNNFMQFKLDEPRRKMEALQLGQAEQADKDDKAARTAFQTAKGDPDQALKILETGGNYNVAMKLRSQINDAKLKALDDLSKSLDVTNKRLGTATQLLQPLATLPPEQRQDAYTAALPRVREIVGPDLGAYLPDTYDEGRVNAAMQWGMKANEAVQFRQQAARDAQQTLTTAVTKTELADKLTKQIATWAQTVDNDDEWQQMREQAKHLGGAEVADDVLARFDDTFSPGAVQKAAKLLGAKQDFQHDTVTYTGADGKTHIGEANYDPASGGWTLPGSATPIQNVRKFQRDSAGQVDVGALAKAVLNNPDAYNDLTDSAKTLIWPTLDQAGFRPPPPRDRGQSAATAERWRMNALQKVDENLGLHLIDDTEATRQRTAIEASYKTQLGGDQPAPAAAAPKKAAPPTAPAPPQPPKPPSAVPQTVNDLLASQKPGRYTLTDGSVWVKDASGTIRKE